jgi:hypothetical protein
MKIVSVENFDQFSKIFEANGEIGDDGARDFVFRGQASSLWKLESTLERLISRAIKSGAKVSSRRSFVDDQLKRFRQAIRGRRGNNPTKLEYLEAWALGQHFGLATPLLDWSASPYIALFFAFSNNQKYCHLSNENSHRRSVWCLNSRRIQEVEFHALHSAAPKRVDDGGRRIVRNSFLEENRLTFVIPDIDENQRLVVQSGSFTYCRSGQAVDEWVERFLPEEQDVLIRIDIEEPFGLRRKILKSLDLMNINYASLFPDISGACSHVNSIAEDFF